MNPHTHCRTCLQPLTSKKTARYWSKSRERWITKPDCLDCINKKAAELAKVHPRNKVESMTADEFEASQEAPSTGAREAHHDFYSPQNNRHWKEDEDE